MSRLTHQIEALRKRLRIDAPTQYEIWLAHRAVVEGRDPGVGEAADIARSIEATVAAIETLMTEGRIHAE